MGKRQGVSGKRVYGFPAFCLFVFNVQRSTELFWVLITALDGVDEAAAALVAQGVKAEAIWTVA